MNYINKLGVLLIVFLLTLPTHAKGLSSTEADRQLAKIYTQLYDYKLRVNTVIQIKKLAEQGGVIAQAKMADYYHRGITPFKANSKLAKEMSLKAIRGGLHVKANKENNKYAQFALARLYQYGIGVEKNYREMINLNRKSAKQGLPGSIASMGFCYRTGMGVKKDYKQAIQWYLRAAKQGNENSQFALGYMYLYGEGVNKDSNKAKYWFKKSANQGNKDSRNYLAQIAQGK